MPGAGGGGEGSLQSAGTCSQGVQRTARGLREEGKRTPHRPSLSAPRRSCRLTFDGDDMFADLVLQHRLLHPLQKLVDGVDVGMHRFEALYLGPDGCRVGQLLLVVHGAAAPLRHRRRLLRPGAAAFPLLSPHRDTRAGRRAAGGGGPRRVRAPAAAASLTGPPPPPAPGRVGSSPSLRSPQGAPPSLFVRCHSITAAGQSEPAAAGPMEGGTAEG